jgi:hypothetical protein
MRLLPDLHNDPSKTENDEDLDLLSRHMIVNFI